MRRLRRCDNWQHTAGGPPARGLGIASSVCKSVCKIARLTPQGLSRRWPSSMAHSMCSTSRELAVELVSPCLLVSTKAMFHDHNGDRLQSSADGTTHVDARGDTPVDLEPRAMRPCCVSRKPSQLYCSSCKNVMPFPPRGCTRRLLCLMYMMHSISV